MPRICRFLKSETDTARDGFGKIDEHPGGLIEREREREGERGGGEDVRE